MYAMIVSRLKFRQSVHLRPTQVVPSSAVLWHPLYPRIMRYQKFPDLVPSELMSNPDENGKRFPGGRRLSVIG